MASEVLSRASQESDSVLQMLGKISQMLNERESIIEEMTRKVKHLTTLNNVLYDGTLRLSHPIKLRRSAVGEMNLITSYPMNNLEMPIIKSFQRNEYILADIENRMREVVVNGKPLKVENAIFEGDVTVTNFRARSLDAVTLNDLPFTAESLGSENQTLSSEKLDMVKILRVTNLTAPQYDRAIDEAFSESIFKSLKVDNLFIGDGRTINGIDPRDLLTKDFEGIVRGLKTFDTLSTVNLETDRLIGKNVTFRQVKNFSEKSDFHSIENITIDNLTVEYINGVNVNELLNKAFQRDFHYKIKGNLSIEAPLSVENLQVKTFCGTPVERMLTKSTAQNVSSILHVPNIMVKNAKIKRLNGLDFEKDVAIIGRPNFITTPVIMADLKVKGNLSLDCKNRKSIYCTMTVKEIPDGKVQIYEGPVQILGSLTVKSISFSPSAKLKLYGDDLQQNNRLWKNKKMENDKVTDSKLHNLTSVVNKINTRNQNHSQAVTSEKIRNNGQFSSNAFRTIQHINMTIPALEKFSSDCSAENGCKLRVQTYRDGNFCGLPAVCFCPIQYEILVTNNGIGIAYISKENNIFIRSFDVSAGEFVRFITNTTSYNSVCRGSETAVAAERTWLSRRSSPARLEELPISLITGYVTDVKSVDVDGFTFVAVAQCYDSIADSHNLDVQIFRTNKQGNVEHLQGLQSYGAWSLDMISGPFGTFLAVANSFDSESAREYVYSVIYRLNAKRHSFEAEIYLPTIDCNNVLLTEVQKSELHAMFAQGAGLPILIYSRNSRSPEFFRKQTLSQNFEVRAMATMKIGGKSQLFTATSDDKITIYRYNLEQAWVMQTSAYLTGVQGFIPYTIKPEKRNYLFIPSNAENSTVILELSSN